ncbi:MAG: hypothetical protein WCZ17_08780 [Candidatus Kapaibacterium sp.]
MRDVMLIVHFIGLAMAIGYIITLFMNVLTGKKLGGDESGKFIMNVLSSTVIAHIGVALLILSGGYLMTPYWSILGTKPLLIAKLVLVLVLAGIIGMTGSMGKKLKTGSEPSLLSKVDLFSKIMLLIGLIIIVLAVTVFH